MDEEGVERVVYFVDSITADDAMRPGAIDELLAPTGAWSDVGEDETVDALDRIRRESKPTPPIGDLDNL